MLEIVTALAGRAAVVKLFEVCAKGCGRITKAHYDKQDIETEAYKIKILAAAQALANQITNNSQKEQLTETQKSNLSLEERTQSRVSFQEQKKQMNLEKVIAVAAEELKNEQTVTDEPLDEDWITRFFKNAADISDEEMQSLWGKILAGEIKQPKTYSLRTLELVKNLTKEEARVFEKVANFAVTIVTTNASVVFTLLNNETDKITDTDIALLIEIGLIQANQQDLNFRSMPNNEEQKFISGKFLLIVKIKANTPEFKMRDYVFTKTGSELLKLINPESDFEYLAAIAKSIQNESVDVKYGQITSREENTIHHTALKNFE